MYVYLYICICTIIYYVGVFVSGYFNFAVSQFCLFFGFDIPTCSYIIIIILYLLYLNEFKLNMKS